MPRFFSSILLAVLLHGVSDEAAAQNGTRARDLGITPGVFSPGTLNAITDVKGVRVGHSTRHDGDSVHTGVTAILPHGDVVYHNRVPAAIHVENGYGKLIGKTQVDELGEIETPILLTCTLCVWKAADAMVAYLLADSTMENVRSLNPVVGETNDGYLNDIRARPITAQMVQDALSGASGGPVVEGSVGAGAGTIAFAWKGGIGTASRVLPSRAGGYTVGILVQTNYGGILSVSGVPLGRMLGQYAFKNLIDDGSSADGSIMVVVATDAPLDSRQLKRLARRSMAGVARTGSSFSNGSGDYAIAFSTIRVGSSMQLLNQELSPLFQAAAEATEEAIYNSLLAATKVDGHLGSVEPIPIDALRDALELRDR
ncbi:P1 family peptidase [Congregibacter variabilis]|uniref:P1 family peptidase n=1 Tax=Congregibacter variabilis TaxID=3081200 RepID=A0ABZ0HZA4_9GAMM|nr:P1 family peptidase [Congregibacter sp. IMCC43200]